MKDARGWNARRLAGRPLPNGERDAQIRFLGANSRLTMAEIGQMHGITKQRVHQILRKEATT